MGEVKKGADVVSEKVRHVAKEIGDTKLAQASKKTVRFIIKKRDN
jgi:hypothetical protein